MSCFKYLFELYRPVWLKGLETLILIVSYYIFKSDVECGTISKITFEITEDLLLELKNMAHDEKSSPEELVVRFIRQGLKNQKGLDTMAMVSLNENVMEKVNIESKLTNKTPNEVINDVLWDALGKIEDISDEFDAEKIWGMLEHDKPEGDDVLDRITDLFD